MKKLVILIISCLMLNNLSAQNKTVKFAVGPSLVFPSGNFRSIASAGIGLEGTLLYQLSRRFTIYGTTGFDSFGAKVDGDLIIRSTHHIPILAGIRCYCHNFFTGVGIGTSTYDIGHGGYPNTYFAFSPQIGYEMGKLEVTAKYNYTSWQFLFPAYFNFTAAFKF